MRSQSYADTPSRLKVILRACAPCIPMGAILLLGIASYLNSFAVPLQFDDDSAVRLANNIRSDPDLFRMQSIILRARWLADVTFALNRRLHGELVLGFHLVNLTIHLTTAIAVYLFVQKAIEALQRSFGVSGPDGATFLQRFIPFGTAAIFVCHPVQTQAVTYIAQRYTSLAALLYVESLLSFLMARLAMGDTARKGNPWVWGGASVVSALMAMKCKEIAITLPLMAVVVEATLFRGRLLKNRLFMALVVALLLVIPLQLIYVRSANVSENLFNQIQSAAAETKTISRTDYQLTQFVVIGTYLRLLVLPVRQNVDYDYPTFHSLVDPPVAASLLMHLVLASLGLFLLFRSRRQLTSGTPEAGISMRIAGLGICWFYLALSVESSVIPITDVIFEHRVYLPSVGFFMAVTAGLSGIAIRWVRCRNAAWTAVVLISVVLAAATVARNRTWSSEMSMWQDVLEKSPGKARPRHSVGLLLMKRFRFEEALPHLVKAVELDHWNDRYRITLNSTVTLLDRYKGRCSEGTEYQSTFEKVDPRFRKEWTAVSDNNLGLAYEHLGDLYLAQDNYLKATKLNPALDLAWYNLALVAARRGDAPTRQSSLERLKALNPVLWKDALRRSPP
jgi:tetratricopeptide (TPR) repeat protein